MERRTRRHFVRASYFIIQIMQDCQVEMKPRHYIYCWSTSRHLTSNYGRGYTLSLHLWSFLHSLYGGSSLRKVIFQSVHFYFLRPFRHHRPPQYSTIINIYRHIKPSYVCKSGRLVLLLYKPLTAPAGALFSNYFSPYSFTIPFKRSPTT